MLNIMYKLGIFFANLGFGLISLWIVCFFGNPPGFEESKWILLSYNVTTLLIGLVCVFVVRFVGDKNVNRN